MSQSNIDKPSMQDPAGTLHAGVDLALEKDVAVGKILAANGGDTRNEVVFANHIRRIVEAHPEVKKWDFVVVLYRELWRLCHPQLPKIYQSSLIWHHTDNI